MPRPYRGRGRPGRRPARGGPRGPAAVGRGASGAERSAAAAQRPSPRPRASRAAVDRHRVVRERAAVVQQGVEQLVVADRRDAQLLPDRPLLRARAATRSAAPGRAPHAPGSAASARVGEPVAAGRRRGGGRIAAGAGVTLPRRSPPPPPGRDAAPSTLAGLPSGSTAVPIVLLDRLADLRPGRLADRVELRVRAARQELGAATCACCPPPSPRTRRSVTGSRSYWSAKASTFFVAVGEVEELADLLAVAVLLEAPSSSRRRPSSRWSARRRPGSGTMPNFDALLRGLLHQRRVAVEHADLAAS